MRTGLPRLSAGAATSCAQAAMPARAARAAQAVTLATPQSESLVRVRGRVCLRTPAPAPLGSLAYQRSVPEGCRAPLRGGGGRVGRPAGRRACPASPTKNGTRPFRLASRLPAWDCWSGATLAGRGEGVNARSPLCRTKPSGRGVAPDPTGAARPATGGRAARPQDTTAPVDGRKSRRESPRGRFVKRPPASFSHRSTA